ncbi:MAG: DUF2723 domain-containing protein [Chloroflexi bacterium]|nr:DUF2723 domain-containing protein [Chloroflexota bacterium]
MSRTIVEMQPTSLPFPTALLVLLAYSIPSVFGVAIAQRIGVECVPLALLAVYVFWPQVDLTLSTVIAFASLCACVTATLRHLPDWLPDSLVGVAACALYLHTSAPGMLPADAGEFQLASAVLGIAHPPGYPLYTLLGKLATFLPVGNAAYRVNLLSAFIGALTLVMVCRTVRRATGDKEAGIVAAASLGVAATFWAQSTTANVRSLTALLTALPVYFLISYLRERSPRYIIGFAVTLSLGLTHHGSLSLFIPVYIAYLFLVDRELLISPQRWVQPLCAFLLPLTVLLYLPLRSLMNPPFDPAPIRSVGDFLNHVLALGFRGDLFYFRTIEDLALRIGVLKNILALEFSWVLMSAAILGMVVTLVKHRDLGILFLGIWTINALAALTYRAPQTVEYLIPGYVALACLIGLAAAYLHVATRNKLFAALVTSILLLAAFLNFANNYPSYLALSHDTSTRDSAKNCLSNAPPNAQILANWHWVTPLWYLQLVDGMRPDVTVRYVYPEGATPIAETWQQRIVESVAIAPTIITNYYPNFVELPYRIEPFDNAFYVRTLPSFDLLPGISLVDATLGGVIQILGFRLDHPAVLPGGRLTIHIYWRPLTKLNRDYSFFVHLVDQNGIPFGQGDVTHLAARYTVGEIIADEYTISTLTTTMPGVYRLIAGSYITLPEGGWQRLTTNTGSDNVWLADVQVTPQTQPPVTLHPLRVPFTSGVRLVGADYDDSIPGQRRLYLHWQTTTESPPATRVMIYAGDALYDQTALPTSGPPHYFTTAHDLPENAAQLSVELRGPTDRPLAVLGPWNMPRGQRITLPLPKSRNRYVPLGGEMVLVGADYVESAHRDKDCRVTLRFRSLAPLTHDYVVAPSLTGPSDAWRAGDDSVPALGGIPTLKWLRGWDVEDVHRIPVPGSATTGQATLYLTVYDAFTLKSLAVLDERLARIGQGTILALGKIEVE